MLSRLETQKKVFMSQKGLFVSTVSLTINTSSRHMGDVPLGPTRLSPPSFTDFPRKCASTSAYLILAQPSPGRMTFSAHGRSSRKLGTPLARRIGAIAISSGRSPGWHAAEDIAAPEPRRRQVARPQPRVFLVRRSAERRRRPIVTPSGNYRAPSGTHNYIFDPGQINISQK